MRIDFLVGHLYIALTIERVFMTYQVLARKWRPKVFGEVIGQEHVTRTLQNSVKKQQVAHAYLLTGTRGVGKTTIARIFAKAIRCENLTETGDPCLTCSACTSIDDSSSLDYIEIDGASNTGVDNIRELIENVQYLPTTGSHKVYVIDEVHMLTVNAFNALLKTLEEPPKHVVFIFATTDPQKLLGTVLSRCQRFDFKNVQIDLLVSHIERIAKAEEISFESKDLIVELAKQGKGSVRDTLSLLDQVLSLSIDRNIDEKNLLLSLGLANVKSIGEILDSIITGNKEACSKAFEDVVYENVDLSKFSLQLLDKFFEIIANLDSSGSVDNTIVSANALESVSVSELLWVYETLSKDLQWALSSVDPEQMVHFCLMKICLRKQIFESNSPNIKKKEIASEQVIQQQVIQQEVTPVENNTNVVPHTAEEEISILGEVKIEVEKDWNSFVDFLKIDQKSLAANLERGNLLGDFQVLENSIELEVGFTEDNKIFLDFLKENEAKKTMKDKLSLAYGVESDKMNIQFSLVDAQTQEKKNFLSKVEIEEKDFNLKQEEKRQKIRDNKYIKEAEKIFNTKIDKIILNKKD